MGYIYLNKLECGERVLRLSTQLETIASQYQHGLRRVHRIHCPGIKSLFISTISLGYSVIVYLRFVGLILIRIFFNKTVRGSLFGGRI